jgi:hypothetical protein
MLARQIVVGFGIAAIFPALIYFGVSIFYVSPRTQDFYEYQQPLPPTATAEERKARAAEQKKGRDDFAAAAKAFAQVLFTISTVLGVAAILIGAYLRPHAIGAGLILGGILSLALGYWGHSQYLDDWFRFTSLLAGFAALLLVGFLRLARN